jgi:hypothetical protein
MDKFCPAPGCGATYNVSQHHVGRRFPCNKCGSPLVITAEGIRLAGPAPGAEFALATAIDDEAHVPARPRRAGPSFWTRVLNDLFSWLFGVGLFLLILFLFFPIIDVLKVANRSVPMEAGDARQRHLDQELQAQINKEQKALAQGGPVDEAERKKREEQWKGRRDARTAAKESWEEEKNQLQQAVEAARFSARRAGYWYAWGMMFGFLFLAVAALGYLRPGQPTIRRVVGAVVICGQVLVIFVVYVFQSVFSARL